MTQGLAGLLAVIRVDFDPYLRLSGPVAFAIRWETLIVALAVLLGLLVAARFAARSGRRTGLAPLRLDDLLYIALGAAPGALVGGRLFYALDYLDYYRANPGALANTGQGSLSLLGAVVGATLTAAVIARLLGGPIGRWLDVASTSLLLVIGLGKLAQLAAGGGQGLAWDGPWALAFTGPGPWLSVAPAVPAQPAALYEAIWALLGIPVTFALHAGPLLRALPGWLKQEGRWAQARASRGEEVARGRLRFGYLYAAALVWWLAGRIAIASLWRDERVLGPFCVEQLTGLAVVALLVGGVAASALRRRGTAAAFG